mgnify:CR=1 FL=1
MDNKEAKEFKTDAIYGLNEMLTLINDQTVEINYLISLMILQLGVMAGLPL